MGCITGSLGHQALLKYVILILSFQDRPYEKRKKKKKKKPGYCHPKAPSKNDMTSCQTWEMECHEQKNGIHIYVQEYGEVVL